VRDEMQRFALEFPCYGSRRMAAELQRRGQKVNRKRVQRLMRLIGLEAVYPKPRLSIRGAGQGFTYNFGRGLSALAPYVVGAIADHSGLGSALLLNSGFFLIAAGLVFTLPETKATTL